MGWFVRQQIGQMDSSNQVLWKTEVWQSWNRTLDIYIYTSLISSLHCLFTHESLQGFPSQSFLQVNYEASSIKLKTTTFVTIRHSGNTLTPTWLVYKYCLGLCDHPLVFSTHPLYSGKHGKCKHINLWGTKDKVWPKVQWSKLISSVSYKSVLVSPVYFSPTGT